MIVGAGTSGSVILKEMMTSRHTNGTVVCFVDDDLNKKGKYLNGVPIAGSREDIPGLALTDITIDKSGCYGTFSLCYDTGDSPAGELYLNVSFDEQFVPSQKVGYDTF